MQESHRQSIRQRLQVIYIGNDNINKDFTILYVLRFRIGTIMRHCLIYLVPFNEDECLTKCCTDNGIPNECFHEEIDSMKVYPVNDTHKSLQIVHSDKCIVYSSILRDCKKDCMSCTPNKCLNGGTCSVFDGSCTCRAGCSGRRCQNCIEGIQNEYFRSPMIIEAF